MNPGLVAGIFGGPLAQQQAGPLVPVGVTGVTGTKTNAVAATSDTLTLSGIPTSAQTVVLFIFEFPTASGPVGSVTGCGATWTKRKIETFFTIACSVWTGTGCDGINNTITWHSPGAMQNEFIAVVVQGVVTAGLTVASASAGSTTAQNTGANAPSVAGNGIILGAVCVAGGAHVFAQGASSPAAWTAGPVGPLVDMVTGYYLNPSTSTTTYRQTTTVAADYCAASLFLAG